MAIGCNKLPKKAIHEGSASEFHRGLDTTPLILFGEDCVSCGDGKRIVERNSSHQSALFKYDENEVGSLI